MEIYFLFLIIFFSAIIFLIFLKLSRFQNEYSSNPKESKAEIIKVEAEKKILNDQINSLQKKLNEISESNIKLSSDYAALKATLDEREVSYQKQLEQLDEQKSLLKEEFENLANKIFETKGKSFSEANKNALDALLTPFKEQIEGFQKRVNDIHTESVKGNTQLESEIKKVLDVGLKMQNEALNLTSALKGDTQQRGAWGEAQLERTLQMSGLLKDQHYSSQDSFNSSEGVKRTDYLIRLPGDKCIIIDSKMTLADYDRAVSADTDEERQLALKAHVLSVKKHIDDLSKKDYTDLPSLHSPDFILMFMPIEPAYIEALKFDKELFSYGYQKNIVLVSHTTLIPILRTVSNLWIVQDSNDQARQLGDQALGIYNSVCTITDRVQALGKTLGTVGNHYNDIVTGLVGNQGLSSKVERFGQLSNKAKKNIKNLDSIQIAGEDSRLELPKKSATLLSIDDD